MGWTKHFTDGSQISEPASWSRTRLENITKVTLEFADKTVSLSGYYRYWQEDDYEIRSGETVPTMVARKIMGKRVAIGPSIFVIEIQANGNIKKYFLREHGNLP
jgi:hypothetical protein